MADGTRSLVVGLDGSESALVALDWAAAEAAERNWPLRLVNAFLSRTPEVAYLAQLPTATLGREAAGRIFEAAKRRLAGGGFAELAVSSLARRDSRGGFCCRRPSKATGSSWAVAAPAGWPTCCWAPPRLPAPRTARAHP